MSDSTSIHLFPIDRYWFLTWTTYGTWLPGDARGYVGNAPDESGQVIRHNQVNTPPARPNPKLRKSVEQRLKGPPVFLHVTQADALLEQFQETTLHRHWTLGAVAIMATHLHVLIGVPGDPDPGKILGDLKSYGSRRLSRDQKRPASGTWWTTGGSKRKLDNEQVIPGVVHYIRQQSHPLLIWTRDDGRTT